MTHFEKWLSNRGLLEKFEYNLQKDSIENRRFDHNSLDALLLKEHETDYMDYAFDWYKCPEGFHFWDDLNDEWIRSIRSKKL